MLHVVVGHIRTHHGGQTCFVYCKHEKLKLSIAILHFPVHLVAIGIHKESHSHHHVHLQHVILELHVLLASAVNKGTEQRRRRMQSPALRSTWSEGKK